MKTITREEYNRLTAGLNIPAKKDKKKVDIEKVKAKAIEAWRKFTVKVEIKNDDGTTSIGKVKPYKNLSFKEIGNVKVIWTNREGQQEKEYPAIEWESGKTAVLMGWFYKGVTPIPNSDGLYMFGK